MFTDHPPSLSPCQVALSLIVSRTPSLSLAPFALQELDTAHRLFAKVAEECPKVAQALVGLLARVSAHAHGLGQPLLTKIAERSRRSYVQWRTSAGDATMDVDQDKVPVDNGPFAAVHSDLVRCLSDLDKRPVPPLPTFVPPSKLAVEPEARPDPVVTHDLSSDMLALALGKHGDLARHAVSDSVATGVGPQRVGNHTFNFDFGALASNVESQSNTYMSWF